MLLQSSTHSRLTGRKKEKTNATDVSLSLSVHCLTSLYGCHLTACFLTLSGLAERKKTFFGANDKKGHGKEIVSVVSYLKGVGEVRGKRIAIEREFQPTHTTAHPEFELGTKGNSWIKTDVKHVRFVNQRLASCHRQEIREISSHDST